MATKKTVTKAAAKPEAPKAEVKAAPVVKEETKPVVKAEAKAEPAKAEVKAAPVEKKAPAKKAADKAPAKKTAAKTTKAAAKPAAKKAPAKKAPAKKEITVADIAEKLAKKLDAKKAAAIDGKAAVDIKLYGAFEAHMYIEVKDGKLNVAPYDYIERDIEAAISVENALAIIDGKLTIADALADGRLYAFGNIGVAAKLAKLF